MGVTMYKMIGSTDAPAPHPVEDPMIDATQIRKGMIIIMDGTLFRVMEMQLITPGRWKAMVQTKLRNIQNGSQTEHRFRSEERLEQAYLAEVEMEYLYKEGDHYNFMDNRTYDQTFLTEEQMGEAKNFIKDNTIYNNHQAGIRLSVLQTLEISDLRFA